jgi:hypothetical protein
MNDQEADKIIEQMRSRYLPTRMRQSFHCGVIVLTSLLTGLLYFHFFAELPSVLTPVDVNKARLGFGLESGLLLAAVGLIFYTLWTAWRLLKVRRMAIDEITVVQIQEIKDGAAKKDQGID